METICTGFSEADIRAAWENGESWTPTPGLVEAVARLVGAEYTSVHRVPCYVNLEAGTVEADAAPYYPYGVRGFEAATVLKNEVRRAAGMFERSTPAELIAPNHHR